MYYFRHNWKQKFWLLVGIINWKIRRLQGQAANLFEQARLRQTPEICKLLQTTEIWR